MRSLRNPHARPLHRGVNGLALTMSLTTSVGMTLSRKIKTNTILDHLRVKRVGTLRVTRNAM